MNTQQQADEFPKFLITINGEKQFLSLRRAAGAFSSLWSNVEIGSLVQESDDKVRDIRMEERNKIIQLADEIDQSK